MFWFSSSRLCARVSSAASPLPPVAMRLLDQLHFHTLSWDSALHLASAAITEHRVSLATPHYNALLSIMAREAAFQASGVVEEHMVRAQVVPDGGTLRILMLTSLRMGDWSNALELMEVIRGEHMVPFDPLLVGIALRACGVGANWDSALRLFRKVAKNIFFADAELSNILMKILHNSHRYVEVVRLGQVLNSTLPHALNDTVISMLFNAAEKTGDWAASLNVLQRMWDRESERRVPSEVLGHVLRTLTLCDQYQLVEEVYDTLKLRVARINEVGFHAMAVAAMRTNQSTLCLNIVRDAAASFVPLFSSTHECILLTLQKSPADLHEQHFIWNMFLRVGVSPLDSSMRVFLERCSEGWEAAMRLLPSIRQPSIIMHVALLDVLCRQGMWAPAAQLLVGIPRKSTPPPSGMIATMPLPQDALEIFRNPNPEPHQTLTITYDFLLMACDCWLASLAIVKLMKLRDVALSLHTLSAICDLAASKRSWHLCAVAINELKRMKMTDSDVHSKVCVKVLRTAVMCGHGAVTHRTISLLTQRGFQIDTDIANLVLHACSTENRWEDATKILRMFPSHKLVGDDTTSRILFTVCLRAPWRASLRILNFCENMRMPDMGMLYKSALSRALYALKWDVACTLQNLMVRNDAGCTPLHYHKMLCLLGGQSRWRETLSLFHRMVVEGVGPTPPVWAFVGISVLESQQWYNAAVYLRSHMTYSTPKVIVEGISEVLYTIVPSKDRIFSKLHAEARLAHLALRMRFRTSTGSAVDIANLLREEPKSFQAALSACRELGRVVLCLQILYLVIVEGIRLQVDNLSEAVCFVVVHSINTAEYVVRALEFVSFLVEDVKQCVFQALLSRHELRQLPYAFVNSLLSRTLLLRHATRERVAGIVRNLIHHQSGNFHSESARIIWALHLLPHEVSDGQEPLPVGICDEICAKGQGLGSEQMLFQWALVRSPVNFLSLRDIRGSLEDRGRWESALQAVFYECLGGADGTDRAESLKQILPMLSSWGAAVDILRDFSCHVSVSQSAIKSLIDVLTHGVFWKKALNVLDTISWPSSIHHIASMANVLSKQGMWEHCLELFHMALMPRTSLCFVGDLPQSTTGEDLRAKFSRYGTVMDIAMPHHEKARERNYAFVRFIEEDGARQAIQRMKSDFGFLGRNETTGSKLALFKLSPSQCNDSGVRSLLADVCPVEEVHVTKKDSVIVRVPSRSCGLLAVKYLNEVYRFTHGVNAELGRTRDTWQGRSPTVLLLDESSRHRDEAAHIARAAIEAAACCAQWNVATHLYVASRDHFPDAALGDSALRALALAGKWELQLRLFDLDTQVGHSPRTVADLMYGMRHMWVKALSFGALSHFASHRDVLSSALEIMRASGLRKAALGLFREHETIMRNDKENLFTALLCTVHAGASPTVAQVMFGIEITEQNVKEHITGLLQLRHPRVEVCAQILEAFPSPSEAVLIVFHRAVQLGMWEVASMMLSKLKDPPPGLSANLSRISRGQPSKKVEGSLQIDWEGLVRNKEINKVWELIRSLEAEQRSLSSVSPTASQALSAAFEANPPPYAEVLLAPLSALGIEIRANSIKQILAKARSQSMPSNSPAFATFLHWTGTSAGLACLMSAHPQHREVWNQFVAVLQLRGLRKAFLYFLLTSRLQGYPMERRYYILCAMTPERGNRNDQQDSLQKLLVEAKFTFEDNEWEIFQDLLSQLHELSSHFGVPPDLKKLHEESVDLVDKFERLHWYMSVEELEALLGADCVSWKTALRRFGPERATERLLCVGQWDEALCAVTQSFPTNDVNVRLAVAIAKYASNVPWTFAYRQGFEGLAIEAARRVPFSRQLPLWVEAATVLLRLITIHPHDSIPLLSSPEHITNKDDRDALTKRFLLSCQLRGDWMTAVTYLLGLPSHGVPQTIFHITRCFRNSHPVLGELLQHSNITPVMRDICQHALTGSPAQQYPMVFRYCKDDAERRKAAIEMGIDIDGPYVASVVRQIHNCVRKTPQDWATAIRCVLTAFRRKMSERALGDIVNRKGLWFCVFSASPSPKVAMDFFRLVHNEAGRVLSTISYEKIAFSINHGAYSWTDALGLLQNYFSLNREPSERLASEVVPNVQARGAPWDVTLRAYGHFLHRWGTPMKSFPVFIAAMRALRQTANLPKHVQQRGSDDVLRDYVASLPTLQRRRDDEIITTHIRLGSWRQGLRALGAMRSHDGITGFDVQHERWEMEYKRRREQEFVANVPTSPHTSLQPPELDTSYFT